MAVQPGENGLAAIDVIFAVAQSKLTSLRGFVIAVFLRTTAKSVCTTSISQSPFHGNIALRAEKWRCYFSDKNKTRDKMMFLWV